MKGQRGLFSRAELATMRDRTAARNYSAAKDEFRRQHERHRAWGLTQRHAERLRRLDAARAAHAAEAEPETGTAGSDPGPSSAPKNGATVSNVRAGHTTAATDTTAVSAVEDTSAGCGQTESGTPGVGSGATSADAAKTGTAPGDDLPQASRLVSRPVAHETPPAEPARDRPAIEEATDPRPGKQVHQRERATLPQAQESFAAGGEAGRRLRPRPVAPNTCMFAARHGTTDAGETGAVPRPGPPIPVRHTRSARPPPSHLPPRPPRTSPRRPGGSGRSGRARARDAGRTEPKARSTRHRARDTRHGTRDTRHGTRDTRHGTQSTEHGAQRTEHTGPTHRAHGEVASDWVWLRLALGGLGPDRVVLGG
ncbi:hypothetical protein FB565_002879 [Actinoplanes lutulentus]|uniref:Uncharacterized protein n=1 Tax=Actinoplanes lutulentus TaxID=1287878 RepID=A0A327YW75_9ACTN|nr:hypothetical protein [Actinoplanes lutulentus]RAK25539.1 hypothetical protein B0I29_1321 [Actinoplanes lutulentus]